MDIIDDIILIIANYCQYGLDKPQWINKNFYCPEPISIDKENFLLVHYTPIPSDMIQVPSRSRYNYITEREEYYHIRSEQLFYFSDISDSDIYYTEITLIKHYHENINQDLHQVISFGLTPCSDKIDFPYEMPDKSFLNVNGGLVGWCSLTIGIHSDDGCIFRGISINGIKTDLVVANKSSK